MTTLFWMDSPQPLVAAWSMARIERAYTQIWVVAAQVAGRGVAVILDLGFTTRASRACFADLTRDAGLAPQLHFVDVAANERWRRVEARNAASNGQLDFAVTREMFDFIEAMWEAPDAAEIAAMEGLRL